ncbi:MAG: hypothetical protein FWD71_09435 [Oscillospiraceae bacterium]|nr:hypothetical protein [Oscillospiraceae bacterium]
MISLYTAVGRFELRTNKNGQYGELNRIILVRGLRGRKRNSAKTKDSWRNFKRKNFDGTERIKIKAAKI